MAIRIEKPSYWRRRELKEQEALLDAAIERTEADLIKRYYNIQESLVKEIENVFLKIQSETPGDGSALVSHLYQADRYTDLYNKISEELAELTRYTGRKLQQNLEGIYIERFEQVEEMAHTAKASGLLAGFQNYTREELRRRAAQAVAVSWVGDGKNFSERLWASTGALQERLNSTLIEFLTTGNSKNVRRLTDTLAAERMEARTAEFMQKHPELQGRDLAAALREEFTKAYHEAERVTRTELCHAQTMATMDSYKAVGVKYYRVIATEDERTCDVCKDSTEPVPIDLARTGDNIPPFHPNCRCCIVAELD